MTLILVSDHPSNKIYILWIQAAVWYHGKRTFIIQIFLKCQTTHYTLSVLWADSSGHGRPSPCLRTMCNYKMVICCDWKGCYESIKERHNTLSSRKRNDFQGKGGNLSEKRHLNKSLLRNESESVCVYVHGTLVVSSHWKIRNACSANV